MSGSDEIARLLERYRGEGRHERGYPDLHDHVLALHRAGLLTVVDEPINKDTEMHPLVRWQYRGGIAETDRRAFLFTRATDGKVARYDIAVLVAGLAANPEVYRIGFGRPLEEIGAAWVKALGAPVEPRVVTAAPCQDICVLGDALDAAGAALDGLPVPISTPGFDNAPYLSAGHYITKDPENGRQNVGNYRGQLKAPRRLGMNPSVELRAGIYAHWLKYKARHEPMPCAVVVGCPPLVSYAAVTKLPEDLDELAVAGGLAGVPINVVRGKTVDVFVPAEAEIVIEGLIDTEFLEPEAPFGESHGYVNLQEYNAFMNVTAVTRRRNAILTSFISQVAPSESSVIRRVAMEPLYLHHLRAVLGVNSVKRVAMHEPLTSLYAVIGIQFARGAPETEIWRALNGASTLHRFAGKWIVAVDEDIDPQNADALLWAMSYRCQPQQISSSCRTSTPATARAGLAITAKPQPCSSMRRSKAPTHRWPCPSANSWSGRERSGNGSACRRSSRKVRGMATNSAIGRPNSSARRAWPRQAITLRSAARPAISGAAMSP